MTDSRLWRRLLAELLGGAFLAAVVIGSGIAAQRLSPGDTGLELGENAAATAAGLYAIILMFGPVSGGHFNPVVSLADAFFGGLSWRDAAAYLPAQVAGCTGGAVVANLMFARAAVSVSAKHRATPAHLLSEVVATLGLIIVIFALARSGRARTAPAAVGAYIGAAYFFTSSTSFANPAITIGRMFSATFAGIAPSSVPAFIGAQVIGCVLAVGVITALYPGITPRRRRRSLSPATAITPPAMDRPATGWNVKGHLMTDIPEVLFVCTHNAGRSQMAAAVLDQQAAGRVRVTSAGSQPASELNPAVVQAMAEIGLDISAQIPKPLTTGKVRAADIVITMGCGDACPVFPGQRYLDWDLPDPAGLTVEQVRPIRDEISARVRALLAEMEGRGPS